MNDNLENLNTLIQVISQEITKHNELTGTTINKSKTQAYWRIGSFISKHLTYHPDDADYKKNLYNDLAASLSIGKTTLYRASHFHKAYPEISITETNITWTHFKVLVTVKSPQQRKYFEDLIINNNISVKQLIAMVRKSKEDEMKNPGKLQRYSGLFNLYRITTRHNIICLDQGFYTYYKKAHNILITQDTNKLIRVTETDKGYTYTPTNDDKDLLFTYLAKINKIIDGDTISVDINLGFGSDTMETLRLRGINAYDLVTKEGKAAKDYVTKELANLPFIVIKTYSRDLYARFLADIFYHPTLRDPYEILNNGYLLNQRLLDEKHAVKYYRY